MTTRIKVDVEIVPEQCCDCGVYFGIDSYHKKRLLETGDSFFCPNGHEQYYTQKESLVEQLNKVKAELQEAHTNKKYYYNKLKDTERSLSAAKGVVTRMKNRIKNGVCPVCNRSFDNLHRHMKGQHPNYADEN